MVLLPLSLPSSGRHVPTHTSPIWFCVHQCVSLSVLDMYMCTGTLVHRCWRRGQKQVIVISPFTATQSIFWDRVSLARESQEPPTAAGGLPHHSPPEYTAAQLELQHWATSLTLFPQYCYNLPISPDFKRINEMSQASKSIALTKRQWTLKKKKSYHLFFPI